MQTKCSNYNWFIVHFFDAPQRNGRKKGRTKGASPLVDPPLAVACTYGANKLHGTVLPSV